MQQINWPEFWKRLEETAKIVDTWPDWKKGSIVNKRTPKYLDETPECLESE